MGERVFTLADVEAAATEVGGDLTIDLASLGGTGTLLLEGKQLSELDFVNEGVDFVVGGQPSGQAEISLSSPSTSLDRNDPGVALDFGSAFAGAVSGAMLEVTNVGGSNAIILDVSGLDDEFSFYPGPSCSVLRSVIYLSWAGAVSKSQYCHPEKVLDWPLRSWGRGPPGRIAFEQFFIGICHEKYPANYNPPSNKAPDEGAGSRHPLGGLDFSRQRRQVFATTD